MIRTLLTKYNLALVLLAGILLSFGLFFYIQRADHEASVLQFNQLAVPRMAAIRANISTAIDTVVMLGGHFSVVPPADTSRDDFTTLATESWQRHPYVQALAGVAYVKGPDRVKIEKMIRERDNDLAFKFTERGPDGKMKPDIDRDDYVTVLYEVPKEGNEAAFGYNLASDPVRRTSIERARQTGEITSTGRITLVQGKGDQYGILVFKPIYKPGTADSADARYENFVGMAQGVFRIGDLINLAAANKNGSDDLPIDVHVYDMTAQDGNRQLFPKSPEVALAQLQSDLFSETSVNVGGRDWKIVISPNSGFTNPIVSMNAFLALAAGLMATIGITLYVRQGQERAINEALQETNRQLEMQQSELEAKSVELVQANIAANAANIAKSEFLSSMSHELRTPLHAIIGFSELLLSSTKTNLTERDKKQVNQINKSGEYLLYLINEILEFTKIEAGVITIALQDFGLRTLLDDCVQLAEPIMAKYGVSLYDDTPSELPNVHIDPGRGRQIIINLLSNAAKYNKLGGEVRVTAEVRQPGFITVSVMDTGIGIDPAKLPDLFTPFNRLGAENTAIEGSGIGLALVKNLLEMMGGQVTCKSVMGEGSIFSCAIPLSGSQERIVELTPAAELVPTRKSQSNVARSILYIEDNPANVALMQDFIENLAGWSLSVATSAEEGIEKAHQVAFDLIICDINLPDMSGVDAVEQLKQCNHGRKFVPILALSADATGKSIERAMKAGFTDYLTKPIRLRELEGHMVRQLESA